MKVTDFLVRFAQPVRAPSDEGAGGDVADTGADTVAGGDTGDVADAGGGSAKWYEADAISSEDRDWLTAKGLATDDPQEALMKAIKGYRSGEQKLGKPADTLMSRPADGQALPEWMRENAALFGLPEDAAGYEITRPDMPEGIEYDEALEGKVREIAFAEGVPPEAVQKLVSAYAEHAEGVVSSLNDGLAAAKQEMMTELERDWGDQTKAKLTLARQAMGALSEAAGLDAAAQQELSAALKEKSGDAVVMKLFATLGGMMAEDGIGGLSTGSTTMGTTPADARAQLAALRAPGGEYYEASARRDTQALKDLSARIDQLNKIAAGG